MGARTPTGARYYYGRFTDQAYNQILLAEDEARMLGRSTVEPEHLLLALARKGNAADLLAQAGLQARAIFALLFRAHGLGTELLRGTVPRSPASEAVLAGALLAAAECGVRGPSTEHVLLALARHEPTAEMLRELGVGDVAALVRARYPPTREPLALLGVEPPDGDTGMARTPPQPGPIPPLFERFSVQALAAVKAGVECARTLQCGYVEPADLLIGLLGAGDGVLAAVRARHERELRDAAVRAVELLSDGGRARPTDIFSGAARALIAEEVPDLARRLGAHVCLSSGHVLLAAMQSEDAKIAEALRVLPDSAALAAQVRSALPGRERMSL